MPVNIWPMNTDVLFEATILDRADGTAVNNAVGTVTIYDGTSGDAAIAVAAVSFGYVAASSGVYRAIVDMSGLTAGQTYQARIVFSSPHDYEQRITRTAEFIGTTGC